MCLTLQPDAPLHQPTSARFWMQGVFYWPGGNSEVKAGQKTDGYRRDKADVHCNVIRFATAWIMPAPTGSVGEEDFLVGAQKHHCCGCIFVCFTSAQDAAVVGKTSGDFLLLSFRKDYLSGLFLTTLPHTMHNLRHLLTIVLSAFQEMSYFDQKSNCFRKWLPVEN